MARALSQTLTRISSSPNPTTILYTRSSSPSSPSSSPLALSPRIFSHRNRSNRSGKAQLVEVDLDSSDGGGGGGVEVEVMGVRRLDDVIHSIIVRRSAPDWLPFIPGSSYWVPPRRQQASGIVELIGKLTKPLSDDEHMSFTTERGWPSSAYFTQGSPHPAPLELQVKVEVKVEDNSDDASQSEDEEG